MILLPRRLTPALAGLLIAVIGMTGPSADASETAEDHVRPVVNRHQFTRFQQVFDLNRDQRMIAELLYGDYADAIDALIEETDAAAEAAGRSRVDAATSGRTNMSRQTLTDLRIAVLDAYAASWPQADGLFTQLMDDLEIQVLTSDQARALPAARNALEREILLHPRQQERHDHRYAGDGVDLIELVAIASRRNAELEHLDPGILADTLSRYETELHALLDTTAAAWRTTRHDARCARIRRNADDIRAAERRVIENWTRLDALTTRTAATLGEIIHTHLGFEASNAWADRVRDARFPWMYRPTKADRALKWIETHVSDQNIITEAFAIHTECDLQLRALRDGAINIMLRARREHAFILYPMINPSEVPDGKPHDLYQSLVRNSGELATLDDACAGRMESLLEEGMRRRMRREIR